MTDRFKEILGLHPSSANSKREIRPIIELLLQAEDRLIYARRFLNSKDHDVEFVDEAIWAIDKFRKGER